MVTQSSSNSHNFVSAGWIETFFTQAREGFANAYCEWIDRRAQRRIERDAIATLRGMSHYDLKDIGLSRSQIISAVRSEMEMRGSEMG